MTEKLYEALEVCIRALETGADIESVLKLYPQMETELRPILETMQRAQSLSAPSIPDAVMRRGRARVLQHAAAMRESARKPRRVRFMFTRFATSLALALVFLLGGTRIVSASSGALPGDNLYPVKRSWEEIRLWFVFSPEGREELESEYEQERLNEVDELLTEGREETIAFYGIVTAQGGDYWLVSGVPVQITPVSQLPVEPVLVGMPVTIVGRTNSQGFIEAMLVGALDPGVSLPPLKPTELETEAEEQDEPRSKIGDNGIAPQVQSQTFMFRGVVTSKNNDIWYINKQQVDMSIASINGNISVGSFVNYEGYYIPDGTFIVVEMAAVSSHEDSSSLPETGLSNGETSTTVETPKTFEFRGVVSSQKNGIWIINGQQVDVSQAIMVGNISVGSVVKLEGYYGTNGKFIVTEIEERGNNRNSGSSESGRGSSNENGDDD